MIKRIWVEVLRHPDGCPTYGSRGQIYRTKLGGADGPVLCERTMTPTGDGCRALLACGITGQFETWHEGDSFARLTGDIEKAARLEAKEGPVRFVRYEPIVTTEEAPQTQPDSPPLSDGHAAGPDYRLGASRLPTADLAAAGANCEEGIEYNPLVLGRRRSNQSRFCQGQCRSSHLALGRAALE